MTLEEIERQETALDESLEVEEEEYALPAMKIGLDEWCFHNSMLLGKMTLMDVVDKAAELKLDGVGFDYFMMKREMRKNPEEIRDKLRESGLELVFGFGLPFSLPEVIFQAMEKMKNEMFDLAHEFGADIVRVYGGLIIPNMFHKPFHLVTDREAEIKEVSRRLKLFTRDASLEGLTVALENHSDYTMREMLQIVHAVDSESFMVTLDTGNALFLGEDPVLTAERLAPYAAYTHIKDLKHTGPMLLGSPLGQGEIDIPKIVEILRDRMYDGLFSIECNLPPWQVEREESAVCESVAFLRGLEGSAKEDEG
ncbi:MAG TPA: sugar phosphate isomerase/epimerase family protein [bacterium]|nr:sugar phosphate isomerase/epimerase family protein [bacterium]